MGGDVGGGHGDELHRGGILVLNETTKEDTKPGVWSEIHRRVHDGTLPTHARD